MKLVVHLVPTLAGWATPASQEAGGTPEQFLMRKRKANERAVANGTSTLGVSLTSLNLQVQTITEPPEQDTVIAGAPFLAGWPTTTRDYKGEYPGHEGGMGLPATVLLAHWPTTQSRDGNHGGGTANRAMGEGRHGSNLDDFIMLVDSGPTATGSTALTGSTDPSSTSSELPTKVSKPQLSPEMSRWLMGFPVGWSACAPPARPSGGRTSRKMPTKKGTRASRRGPGC